MQNERFIVILDGKDRMELYDKVRSWKHEYRETFGRVLRRRWRWWMRVVYGTTMRDYPYIVSASLTTYPTKLYTDRSNINRPDLVKDVTYYSLLIVYE